MKRLALNKVWVTGLLLAAMATSTLAPIAEADGKWRNRDRDRDRDRREVRYKDSGRHRDRDVRVERRVRYVERTYHRPSHRSRYGTYVVRRSNAGPVIAGFIGGLFLGAALSNAPPRGYDYYDPYCHQRFSTLNAYHREAYAHHHDHHLRVVACESEWGCRGGVHAGRYHDGHADEYGHGHGSYEECDD